jgi:hypothetical protein
MDTGALQLRTAFQYSLVSTVTKLLAELFQSLDLLLRDLFLLHSLLTSSWAYSASCPLGTSALSLRLK